MRMNPRTRLVAVCALVGVALTAAWWTPTGFREAVAAMIPARSAAGASGTVDPRVPASAARAHERNRAGDFEPLPPINAPLANTYALLKQRADHNDGHAACRLAVDLISCRNLPLLQMVADGPDGENEAMFAKQGNLEAANAFAEMKLASIRARQRCEGITLAQTARASVYLKQAAQAGIGDAVVRYADGQGFDPRGMFGVLRDPGFDAWRREARAMALRALRQGNRDAAQLLWLAYSGDYSLFGGLVADDAVQSQAYQVLLDRLYGRTTRPSPALSARQEQEAEATGERMHRHYFDGRTFPEADNPSSVVSGLSQLTDSTAACE
jgi:hypothetical protein